MDAVSLFILAVSLAVLAREVIDCISITGRLAPEPKTDVNSSSPRWRSGAWVETSSMLPLNHDGGAWP